MNSVLKKVNKVYSKKNPSTYIQSFNQLKKFIKSQEVGGLILGLPISMDGTEGPSCQSIYDFASNLSEYIDIGDSLNSDVSFINALLDKASINAGSKSYVFSTVEALAPQDRAAAAKSGLLILVPY